ncbi:MAG: penicillin-binding protein 2 [Candidatus Omnitrophica bacterium]|nr:penicillin-binding protein 2 [Candidatus Omnitrophota bacterium]
MDSRLLRKIFLTGFLIIFFSLFYYQVLKGEYYLERAKNNYVRVIPTFSIRGEIYDRNGIALAYDRPSFQISVIPYQIDQKKEMLFTEIAERLGLDPQKIMRAYKKNRMNMFTPVKIIPDIEKFEAVQLKNEFSEDIMITPQPQRFYPYQAAAAHLLGYVKKASSFYETLKRYGYTPLERAGFKGIEQYYDTYLKGQDGGDLIEVNAKGRMVGFLGERKPERGKSITLTIDAHIQQAAYDALEGKTGTLLFMEADSGKMLALVSRPAFDPHAFITGEGLGSIMKNEKKPLLNRTVQATYPLGSTFKPIVGYAGLAEKKIRPGTTFRCDGVFKVGIARFRCWSRHGTQDLYEALAHSCNVYFYNLGLLLGGEKIARWAKAFGLDSRTHIDLPHEKKGTVPGPQWKARTLHSTWYKGDTVNYSIGQGYFEATPLQVLVATNVFATGGYLVRPHLLHKVEDEISGADKREYLRLNPDHLETIVEGMRQVVTAEEGTARQLRSLHIGMCGKTGTAQTSGPNHGWFVGFFPYQRPHYTICVFLEHGESSYEAVKVSYRFLKILQEKNLFSQREAPAL